MERRPGARGGDGRPRGLVRRVARVGGEDAEEPRRDVGGVEEKVADPVERILPGGGGRGHARGEVPGEALRRVGREHRAVDGGVDDWGRIGRGLGGDGEERVERGAVGGALENDVGEGRVERGRSLGAGAEGEGGEGDGGEAKEAREAAHEESVARGEEGRHSSGEVQVDGRRMHAVHDAPAALALPAGPRKPHVPPVAVRGTPRRRKKRHDVRHRRGNGEHGQGRCRGAAREGEVGPGHRARRGQGRSVEGEGGRGGDRRSARRGGARARAGGRRGGLPARPPEHGRAGLPHVPGRRDRRGGRRGEAERREARRAALVGERPAPRGQRPDRGAEPGGEAALGDRRHQADRAASGLLHGEPGRLARDAGPGRPAELPPRRPSRST